MNKEIWRDIPNMEGYMASNLGKIKSTKRYIYDINKKKNILYSQDKILKGTKGEKGYLKVYTKYGNKSVHRLVASTFIPNPNNLPQVNHIDCNKENNNINNLEWCTNLYNHREARKNGLYKNAHPKGRKINQYDLNGNLIKQWEKIKDIEKELKLQHSNIIKCCKGERKHTGGFCFKYC